MIRPLSAAVVLWLITTPAAWAAPSTDMARMPAGTYVLDPDHASLLARVKHQGFSNFTIRFRITEASYQWDPKAPQSAVVKASVGAATFDTGLPDKDPGLARDFLEIDRFPTATFVSTSIQPGEGGRGTMTGDLTLHGVTRPVTFDVTWNGYDSGLFGQRSGFSARGVIKRSDFGVTRMLKPPLAFVGDEVELILELEFLKQ